MRELCDEALADYNFGEGVSVEAVNGWEYSNTSNEVTCAVFLRFDDDEMDADTHAGTFSVTVVDGKVVDKSCQCEGNFVGTPF